MPYRQLWILVEGDDDERFFERIRPSLEEKYDHVRPPWKYQQKTRRQIGNFLRSLKAMNSGYVFLTDLNRSPCIPGKKNSVKRKYGARIDVDNVVVVVRAIESWYLAGLDNTSCNELGIKPFRKTDNITKEQFKKLMPKKSGSRIDFMVEVLKRFSVDIAMRKNRSFAYFMKKI